MTKRVCLPRAGIDEDHGGLKLGSKVDKPSPLDKQKETVKQLVCTIISIEYMPD